MENNNFFTRIRKVFDSYEIICKPYCQEIGLSVQAFEIILFIAKSKNAATAQDICKRQNIKPTLMSFHIEKLVQAGYVERQEIDGNRRSIKLVCTEKANPIIEKGKELTQKYQSLIWEGVTKEEVEKLTSIVDKIDANVDRIIKEGC